MKNIDYKKRKTILSVLIFMIFLFGCAGKSENNEQMASEESEVYTLDTKVTDVINDPVFEDYGRLIFPADVSIDRNLTLKNVDSILMWYSNVNPDKTVEIANYMKEHAKAGEQIFYDMPLIYRPGAQTACEDLARAIAFIHENADELGVDTDGYSLWGGSAGARMAVWLGSYGTDAFGEKRYPAPEAVIMQYTGLSETDGSEPPTYACVGTSDGIAPYRTMESRIRQIKAQGTDTEIEGFEGLHHGFGLGEGTVAEGWIDRALGFWERNQRGI